MPNMNKWTKVALRIRDSKNEPGAFLFHSEYGGYVPPSLKRMIQEDPIPTDKAGAKVFILSPGELVVAGKEFKEYIAKKEEVLPEEEIKSLHKRMNGLKGLWKYYKKASGDGRECRFEVIFGVSAPKAKSS